MHRTTVMIPDDLARLLKLETERRRASAAVLVRQALEAFLRPPVGGHRYSFIGIAQGDGSRISDRVDDFLDEHWAADILADSFSESDANSDR